jgi:SAM-dependent methyltransferase
MDTLGGQAEMVFRLKHGDPAQAGPGPRRRWRFGYFTPDDVYEALLSELVQPGASWIDVGGGRDVFPSNPKLARMLADRCEVLLGLDPSDNIEENPYVHRGVKGTIEDYRDDRTYDLATMRMVAEHIAQPEAAAAALARLIRPGGKLVIYTVNRWAPVSLLSWLVPFRFHHAFKKACWGTEEKDTFPVVYQMNTRSQLSRLLGQAGFREQAFFYLDDCRTFHRFASLNLLELSLWRALRAVRLHYPENCLLGVYERLPAAVGSGRHDSLAGSAPRAPVSLRSRQCR